MGPAGNILVNSPISTFQQGLTHSAMVLFLGQIKGVDVCGGSFSEVLVIVITWRPAPP